jgi:DNA invertase Pin-like site-specific DNA recombinase
VSDIKRIKAGAYLRTSSAANADGDSQTRQRVAIETFAERAGYQLVDEFADVAVSGADLIEGREGFARLLDRIEGNGVRVVIIEDASRLARQLVTQELAIIALIARGVRVLTANGDDLTDDSDPSRVMMRQIAGAFHQYEKARLVSKLKAARDRKRATGVKVEGRQSIAQRDPEATALARQLHRPQHSLRQISAQLAALGFLNHAAKPYTPQSVKSMLESN